VTNQMHVQRRTPAILGAILLGSLLVSFVPAATCEAAGDPRVRLTTSYEKWNQPDLGLGEMTTTLGISIPTSRSSQLDMMAGHAAASGDVPGTVSGLMDTRARFSYMPGEHWAFRAGMSAPTGQTGHGDEETAVVRLLSDRLRGYRGYRLGEGVGADLGSACSFKLGGASLGLGAGYSFKGKYQVLADQEKVDPGDQFRFSVGVDAGNTAWLWRGDFVHARYLADQRAGEDVFQAGPRFDLRTSILHRGRKTNVGMSVQAVVAGKNKVGGTDGLVAETENSNSKEYYVQVNVSHMAGRRVTLQFFTGGRAFAENGFGTGKASRGDLGVGGDVVLGASTKLLMQARYSQASLTEVSGTSGADETQSFGGLMGTLGLEVRL
jgi:hypothetical protein